jgi:PPK2 family polyphosphate:nucleotide phosphotransferase
MLGKKVMKAITAPTDGRFNLSDYDPAWRDTKDLRALSEKQLKKQAKVYLDRDLKLLTECQEKLYADNRYSVLIIFQAMDAAGKDTTIKHVMSGINPQGCEVTSFKHPSATELDHTFLWRYSQALPERGRIGIFNRSYYEEVLVVRVHPELIAAQRIPSKNRGPGFWQARFKDINAFERHLTENGTIIVKFFLNLSKEEQRKRFIERLTNKDKLWKYAPSDLRDRSQWENYLLAYQEMIAHTSTKRAPWHIIPADNKWVMRALVSGVISDTISRLDIGYPEVPKDRLSEIKDALKSLRNE